MHKPIENYFLMTKKKYEEHILIEQLRRGSQKAFNILYDLYFNKVFAYCLQISKSTQKATDITQDVFLRLWETRESIKHESTISPYLFKIARNSLTDAWREVLNSENYEDYIRMRSDEQVDIQPLEYEEFSARIYDSVEKMPPILKSVIKLSRFELLSNKEIASLLGISEQTVKNRLVIALKLLRNNLQH